MIYGCDFVAPLNILHANVGTDMKPFSPWSYTFAF